ncbi:MAG: helix-turn-helix domain-containing protein [Oscillospiraceae bacterium]
MKKWLSAKEHKHFFRYYKTLLVYLALLIMPVLLISGINYITIRDQNYSILENGIRTESIKRLENFGENMRDMSKAVSAFKKNKNFFSNYQKSAPLKYLDMIDSLGDTTFWAAVYHEIYFYDTAGDTFVSAKGTESSEYFLDTYLKTYRPIQFSQFDGTDKTFLFTFNETTNKAAIVIVTPFEKNYTTGKIDSYLLFFLDESVIKDLVSPDLAGEGSAVTLFYGEQPIYSSDSGVNNTVYTETYQSHPEARDRLQYTYQHGDFSLHWMIPKTLFNRSLFVVLLKQAVVTFLLVSVMTALLLLFIQKEYKPLMDIMGKVSGEKSQLSLREEFLQLDFILNDILFSRNTLKETNEELKRENYLYMLLGNRVKRFSSLYNSILDSGIHINRERFACVSLQDRQTNINAFLYLKEQVGRNYQNTDVYELFVAENRYVFLICSDLPQDSIREILSELALRCEESDNSVGIGSVVEEPEQIIDSYRQAVDRTRRHEAAGQEAAFPTVELEALEEAVAVENAAKISMSVNMIRDNLIYYSDITRMYLMVKVAAVFRGEDESEIVQAMGPDVSGTIEYTEAFLTRVCEQYLAGLRDTDEIEESRPEAKSKKISNICHYIEENYMAPDFSIKSMAGTFGTSPSNLSHYFKKMTGQTLSQYIDHIRIKEAVRLLQNPDIKIADVAGRVGYISTNSFIDNFKKHMGTTPKSYQTEAYRKDS